MNYYNEYDSKAAAWLRELIKDGLIPPGEVDERSITEVRPTDLHGFTQCHFFAGVSGWSLALQLAGWPQERPVWTGSCPCQPFSTAGRKRAAADERHLWPEFARLVGQCHPSTVFGEQVASKLGREWLAGVFIDLEAMGYAVAGADLCAAGVGAPHLRQRLFWVADAECTGCKGQLFGRGKGVTPREEHSSNKPWRRGGIDPWSDVTVIRCADGKFRRVPAQPALQPLAYGIPNRMVFLRGAGNAIVPQIAAVFIRSLMNALPNIHP